MARNEKHAGRIFGSTSKNRIKDGTPCNTSAGSVVVIILINIDKAHTGRIHSGSEEGGGIVEWNVPREALRERVEADGRAKVEVRSID